MATQQTDTQTVTAASPVFQSERYTASSRYLQMFAARLKQSNKDVPDKFSAIQLSERQDERISIDALIRAVNYMNKSIGPHFGLEIGYRIHPSDYGIVGHLLMNAYHLGEALNLTARYTPLVCDAFSSTYSDENGYTTYILENRLELDTMTPLIELYFASLLHLSRFLVGKEQARNVRLQAVYFEHSPLSDIEVYKNIFECPVYFNQKNNRVRCHNKVLKLPVYSPNPYILKLIAHKTDRLIQKMEIEIPFRNRVFQYLLNQIPNGMPTAVDAASNFNMSLSTLKKYLLNEDANYSQLCDEARMKLSIRLIGRQDISLKKIAVESGFSNISAFHRAFKRWTGKTPKDYRQELLAGD